MQRLAAVLGVLDPGRQAGDERHLLPGDVPGGALAQGHGDVVVDESEVLRIVGPEPAVAGLGLQQQRESEVRVGHAACGAVREDQLTTRVGLREAAVEAGEPSRGEERTVAGFRIGNGPCAAARPLLLVHLLRGRLTLLTRHVTELSRQPKLGINDYAPSCRRNSSTRTE